MEKKENVFEISSYALRTMEMEKKKVDEKQNRFFFLPIQHGSTHVYFFSPIIARHEKRIKTIFHDLFFSIAPFKDW